MAKENLFEDIGLGDARERLQEVSEYMDKVIRRRRMRAEWDRKDVTKDDMWNLAHGVLEIIHFPVHCTYKCLNCGSEISAPVRFQRQLDSTRCVVCKGVIVRRID